MSDRICLMNEARVEQVAAPADLYFSPKTVFAAGFLGESNTLEGSIESIDGANVRVRHAGMLLEGRLMDAARVGAPCRLMVRPEAVSVSLAPVQGDGLNVLGARVTSHVIGGAIARTVLRTGAGVEIVSTRLTARSATRPQGDAHVSFSSADCLVFGESR